MQSSSSQNPRVVIAGGSGYIGLNLARHMGRLGWECVIVSRSRPRAEGTWRWVAWDGRTLGDWHEQLDGAAAIVNLAGRSVDCIKTPEHCDEILRSRVEATRVLGQAVRAVESPPPVWVQMSTAHIYGDPPVLVCDEESALGYGLAPTVGKAWEEEFAQAVLPTMRSVVLRTSFVLGRDAGALRRLGPMARLGLGGRVGHGRQGISWIHERDMNRLLEQSITGDAMQGVYIATAPNPVSNAVFMRALRQAVGMPIGLPAFAWMVRIAAPLVLRTDPELALLGRYCVPRRLEREGFTFEFPTIEGAMRNLFQPTKVERSVNTPSPG